jgi:transposase
MMGTKIRSFAPLPEDISLENLVPEDHFYRRLQARLDLSFVRELVAPLYAGGGRPSVDPVVFFKLQLVMFFEDLRSERQLMRVVSDCLSVRWYIGYDLHEPLPDHSSLTRIRERFGLTVFRRFFERIVQTCAKAGLVRGEELFFDATKVEANASLESMRSRSLVEGHLEEHLAGMFGEETSFPTRGKERPDEVVVGVVGAGGEERGGEERRALARENALRHRWIASNGRQERGLVRWGYKRMADLRVSPTDPDASPMHEKKKSAGRLGYLTHYVVDGGKARVILDGRGGHGEPPHVGSTVQEPLPLAPAPALGHRRRYLRNEGEHSSNREGGHPGLHRAGRSGKAYRSIHHRRLRLRPTEGPLHLPYRRDPAPPGTRPQGRLREIRREGLRLQRVPPQKQMHEEPERTLGEPRSRRRVSRKGQSLPRH